MLLSTSSLKFRQLEIDGANGEILYQDLAHTGIRIEDNSLTSLAKIHFYLNLRQSPEN
jgi:hypothetical protein